MPEADCFVCRKHRGKVGVPGGIVYEDELVHCSHIVVPEGRARVYLGTLFVEPRRHVAGIGDLHADEAERVGLLASRVAAALQATEGAEHVYVFVLGHHVPHLHVWLAPRYPGTPREFWPLRLAEWPAAPTGGPPEIAALCERVGAHVRRALSAGAARR